MAAHRGGVRTVVIPEENSSDLKEIPDNIKTDLKICRVKWIDEVLDLAFETKPTPLSDEEFNKASAAAKEDMAAGIANTH